MKKMSIVFDATDTGGEDGTTQTFTFEPEAIDGMPLGICLASDDEDGTVEHGLTLDEAKELYAFLCHALSGSFS